MTSAAAIPAKGSALASPSYAATGWTGGRNPWLITVVVTMATFMEYLDTSIANVALPHIAGNLGVSQDESTWVLTSYLVSNAVVLPTSGWMASRFGRKRFYMSCVALFTGASILCGLAPSLPWLILFRVLQGLGGGGLGPSEQAILADTFPPGRRSTAMALYGIAVVLAPAIGPTLGGTITDHLSWRWVFFINVPVGIASLALSRRIVTDPPHLQQARLDKKPIDWPGLALIVAGLASLEVVLDKGQDQDWFASWWIVALSTIAASALFSLVLWELRAAAPIVEVRLFMRRNFAAASALMLVFGAMLFASTVLLPEYLQDLMGYSAQQAGLALTPGGIVVLALLPVVAKLVPRLDARLLLTFGLVVTSAALLHITHGITPQMDFATAMEVRALQSVGLAFLFVPVQTMAYLGVPMQSYNQVSGIINLARYLGGGIGIALVTTLISRRTQFHQVRLLIHSSSHADAVRQHGRTLARAFELAGASSAGAVRRGAAAAYHEVLHQATHLAYLDAFWALGVVMAAGIPVVWLASRQMVPKPSGGRPGEQREPMR